MQPVTNKHKCLLFARPLLFVIVSGSFDKNIPLCSQPDSEIHWKPQKFIEIFAQKYCTHLKPLQFLKVLNFPAEMTKGAK